MSLRLLGASLQRSATFTALKTSRAAASAFSVPTLPKASSFSVTSFQNAISITSDSEPGPNKAEVGYGFLEEDLVMAKPMQSVPGPKSYPVLGSMLSFKPIGKIDNYDAYARCEKLEELYGPIVRLHFPMVPGMDTSIVCLDPEDFELIFRNEGKFPNRLPSPIFIKYRESRNQDLGLFLTNHEDWWKLRQPLNKTMMRANAAYHYLDVQDAIGDELIGNLKETLRKNANHRHPMVMKDVFRWALESVCAVAFDRRIGCLDPDLKKNSWQQEFVDSIHNVFENIIPLSLNPRHQWAHSLGYKTKKWKQFEAGMETIDNTSIRLMEESRAEWKEDQEDLDWSKRFLPQLLSIESLTMSEKVSIIFDMMFAAQDTTTYSLVRVLFFLAKNPEAQEKLYSEICEHVGKPGTPMTPTSLSKLQFMKACIKESQRLKPIVPTNGRVLPVDVVIKGYRIPKGITVLAEHEYASKSAKNFEDPHSFKPERWLREKGKHDGTFNPFAVLPFGFGPRMCVGRRFADQELYIGIVKLVHSFRFEYDGDKMPLKGIGWDKLPIKLDFIIHER